MMMTSHAVILNETCRCTITACGCGILGSPSSTTRRSQKYRSSGFNRSSPENWASAHRVHRMMRDTRYPCFFIIPHRMLARASLVVQDADSLLPGVALRMRRGVHEFYMKRPRRRAQLARRAVRLPPPSLQVATVNLHGPLFALRLFRYLSKRPSRGPGDVIHDAFARI
jgi:hypothetical protein